MLENNFSSQDIFVQAMTAKYKSFVGITEENGPNRSKVIDAINSFMGVTLGSPYCLSGLQFGLEQVENDLGIIIPQVRTAHCMTFWRRCPDDVKFQTPEIGDWGIFQLGNTERGHAVYVFDIQDSQTIKTIEFNTSPEKWMNRDGDGCYERIRFINKIGLMRLVGYVRLKLLVPDILIQKS